MAISLSRFDRVLPAYRTRRGPDADALVLAVGLLVGLVGLVPTFTLAVRYVGVPIPLPSLVATGVVLFAYAAAALLARRVRVGTLAAVLVLGTIGANVPLSATEYPGALGPSVWLFEVPLAVGLAIAVRDGWHRDLLARGRGNWTKGALPQLLFGAFVCWSVLAAVFGAGPSLAAGLSFALHVFTAFCVFVFVAGAIARGWLRFRTVLWVLVAAAVSHMAFGVAQLLYGRNFGLAYLGEVAENSRPIVEVLGVTFHAGPYVAGLTGNSSPFTALALLVIPILALYAIHGRSSGAVRAASGALAVGALALVRVTLKDAARGSAFLVVVGVAVASVAIVLFARRGRGDRQTEWRARVQDGRRTVAGALCLLGSGVATLLVPIRIVQHIPPRKQPSADGTESAVGSSADAGAESAVGSSADAGANTASEAAIRAVSKVAGVDLSSTSVGFRVRQYFGALDAGLDYPLFGLGGANFPYIVERYGIDPAIEPGVDIGNAVHNAYLSVLSGTGVPGLLLFCGLLVSILLAAIGLVRESREDRWLAWGALVGVVGYGALVFWNVMLVTIVGTVAFFAFAGAIVGARTRRTAGVNPAGVRSSVPMSSTHDALGGSKR